MKIGIVGANGYGGVELIRYLVNHPYVEIKLLASHSSNGNSIVEQYPHLQGILEMNISELNIEDVKENIDVLFFATPSGVSKELIPQYIEAGIKIIDLSGDLRLQDGSLYEEWYKNTPAPPFALDKAIYGLTELNRELIKEATLVANPGCYPTATLLGLIPALQHKLIDGNSIVIDGKSGISGAGRKTSATTHYSEINENVKAYKLGKHQHIPEIEQIVSQIGNENITVTFSTHLVPMTRGIMCTMYANLKEPINESKVISLYEDYYKDDYFVRIRKGGTWPATKEVTGSNFCDIGITVDERTNKLIIVAVIDNVVKGAAGQAIQNLNVMYGWDEKTGLQTTPLFP
ncbi:N-acetyl-gamma-glutamyl-phosphate reductase [Sutcliffiella cohnii]|uniref:N-acetyl-gamma-glutamyl-phosphate reductase n=1 Tax=Sutcliffiella TaxID=2837511 RepID=UPI0022DCEE32|nr:MULTISPECIES: N-acetyl-gamma-glutamyl-phosphate reductase [Sutcliffiella]MED4014808.1 N-acetyl-gamma-glutamyl-phosphate reductase [Sutcliffiella cohnii]WBL17443.1 N-acetyl-gamma-glutamyl-phosphate reductase [Sutcliffiella sp. NC1]